MGFGNGNTSSADNPSEIYTTRGSFDVTLTATHTNGCTTSNTLNNFVQVESIDISLSANTALACQGEQVQFLITSNLSGLDYVWDFGDGNTSEIDTEASHIYGNPGTYNVTLQASTSDGSYTVCLNYSRRSRPS